MKKIFIILFFFPLFLYGQKNIVKIDSVLLSFQSKLFSASPIVRKHDAYFYFYDLVSEKLVVADEQGKAVKDTVFSAGKAKTLSPNGEEIKLFYKGMFVGSQSLYFGRGGIFRYSHDFKKLPTEKLRFNHPDTSLRNIPIYDVGFLVEEGKDINRYVVRVFTSSIKSIDGEAYTKESYQRPLYTLFEKAINDTTVVNMKRMIVPYDRIYQDKVPLGYAYRQTITLGKQSTLITGEGATEVIRIYNMEGKEIDTLGEKGKYMSSKDTITKLPYPKELSPAAQKELDKLFFHCQDINPVYGQVYYDAKADKIYREYSPKIEAGEKRKRFMQVYKNKKLIADVPFPPNYRIIAIEDGIIWVYKVNPDGETPPQYLYKIKIQ